VIYCIVPHKERTYDRNRNRFTIEQILKAHEDGAIGDEDTHHPWIAEDVRALITHMQTLVDWTLLIFLDPDDKVGNGIAFCVRKGAGRVSRCSMDGFTCGQLEHFDCDVLCEDCTMKFPVFEGYFDGFVNEEMKRPSQPFQLRG
jgi:hypothetical protein